MSARAGKPPAWTITAALALLYLILAPASSDLAAASYRSDLFARAGFTLWDNSWYGGHHLPAYSLLAPALGALLGPRLLAALSMTIAAALFAALIDGHFPSRASRVAAMWFALGAAIGLLASRVPFDLGLALSLAALLAAQRRRRWLALLFTLLGSLSSPVAGAFLALAFLAWTLTERERIWPAVLTLAALLPIATLTVVFPEGGTQPFVASAFYPALAAILAIAALIPPRPVATRLPEAAGGRDVLLLGTLLYALALIGSYLLPSAVGGNVDRLGALLGAPIVACLLLGGSRIGRRPRLLLVLAPALLYWQANAPVADFASAASDPAVHSSYFDPLLGELRHLGVGYSARPARIEVVPTADHWEARWLAPHVMVARGWERQLDRYRNGLFYDGSTTLTTARYRAWLSAQGISYIALPDSPLDYSGKAEARLLAGAPEGVGPAGAATAAAGGAPAAARRISSGAPISYLREVWHSAHWRLLAVLGASSLAQPPAVLSRLGEDSFTLRVPRAGSFLVRVHFSPYWALTGAGGCVERAPGDWTEVRAPRAGTLHVVIRFSLGRIVSHGPRCR